MKKVKRYRFIFINWDNFYKKVNHEEGERFATARGIEFHRTSSSTGENINEVMDRLINKVI
jgi:hypothetical protein